MISSVIFYLLSPVLGSVSYVDSLFMCVSALTGTGLTTVCLGEHWVSNQFANIFKIGESQLNVFQQIVLFCLLLMGHAIPISAVTLLFRKKACRDSLELLTGIDKIGTDHALDDEGPGTEQLPQWAEKSTVTIKTIHSPDEPSSCQATNIWHIKSAVSQLTRQLNNQLRKVSTFVRTKLFGKRTRPESVEYKALSILTLVVSIYWTAILSIGILVMGSWMKWRHADIPRADGIPPFWAGAFTATSAFVNCGMSLFDDGLVSIQSESVVQSHETR